MYTFVGGKEPSSSPIVGAAINERNEMIILDGHAWDYPFIRQFLLRQYAAIQKRKEDMGG
jgi:hypothetical protein